MSKSSAASARQASAQQSKQRFSVSPLIRITLLLLYIALTLPLPVSADVTQAPVSSDLLFIAILTGGVLLYGGLSEQVTIDEKGITVGYPRWISWLFRRRWHLNWQEITALKPRTTGQGGLVYYFTSDSKQAFLLPMRIAGFAELMRHIETKTQIDTQDIKPLAQPWMYIILLTFSLVLLMIDGWTVWTATQIIRG